MSITRVAIGVAVLIIVLSVMNGFELELRSRILSITSHATVSAFGAGLPDWQDLRETTLANPELAGVAPFIEGEALLVGATADGRSSAAQVRGIDPELEATVSAIDQRMQGGSLNDLVPGGYGVVLGSELADALGVARGDSVVIAIAQGTVTPAGVVPRMRRFAVIGTFFSGMYEIDSTLALVHLDDAGRLFRLRGNVTGLRLAMKDPFRAPPVAREVAHALGGGPVSYTHLRAHET